MKFRKITEADARGVINKVEKGLPHGMGDGGDGQMCVQHVVANVVESRRMVDSPMCVTDTLRSIGISLNDSFGWKSDTARGEGLKRFAVAELGTTSYEYEFNDWRFKKLLHEQNPRWFAELGSGEAEAGDKDRQCTLVRLAEDIVQVLIKMETPGSKFLWLTEEDPSNPTMNSPAPTEDSVDQTLAALKAFRYAMSKQKVEF